MKEVMKAKIIKRVLTLSIFLFTLTIIFPQVRSEVKVYATKLYFQLFKNEGKQQLSRLNMLHTAKEQEELTFWLKVFGPEEVMQDLLNDSGSGTTLDCHTQAHLIGRVSYELYGASIFQKGSSLCHSGFYHGAMEAFLREKGTVDLAREMTNLCEAFDTNFGQFECYHGVGHGVLAFEDYDLPQAIRLCRRLSDSFSQESCFGGVFMENVVTADGKGADSTHTTQWVNDDPHFPCNANELVNDYQVELQCYHMQTSRMLMLFGNNFDRVLEECLRAPENMKNACFRSFGRDAAGQVLRDPGKIVELCGKLPRSERKFIDECVIGAVHVIVDFWGKDIKGQASEFCSKLAGEHKTTCYSGLAKRLPGLFRTKEEKLSICKTFEPPYQNLCK